MANTKSAKKQILINERNRVRNQYYKTRMKGALKSARLAITNLEISEDDAAKVLRDAQRTIYKTASKGVIHKNTASRRYGRLVSLFRKVRVLGIEPIEQKLPADAPVAVTETFEAVSEEPAVTDDIAIESVEAGEVEEVIGQPDAGFQESEESADKDASSQFAHHEPGESGFFEPDAAAEKASNSGMSGGAEEEKVQ